MSLHKCAYCGKELTDNFAVVERFGKTDYYCPNHKGLRNNLDKTFQIVKSILSEPTLPLECRKMLKVSLELLGVDKAYFYLSASQDYWKEKFADKEQDGDFNNIQAKVKYLLGILKNKLPSYEIPQLIYPEGICADIQEGGAKYKRESNTSRLERLLEKSG